MGFTRAGCPCCALSPLPPLSTVDADLVSAGLLLVDTHNHLHQSAGGGANRRCDSYEAVLAVAEACWDSVLARCAEGPRSLPGLGVHPWQAHEVAEGWEARLRALLQQHPRALVGEIGLCKCARSLRGPGAKARVWPQQLRVFRTARPRRGAAAAHVGALRQGAQQPRRRPRRPRRPPSRRRAALLLGQRAPDRPAPLHPRGSAPLLWLLAHGQRRDGRGRRAAARVARRDPRGARRERERG